MKLVVEVPDLCARPDCWHPVSGFVDVDWLTPRVVGLPLRQAIAKLDAAGREDTPLRKVLAKHVERPGARVGTRE